VTAAGWTPAGLDGVRRVPGHPAAWFGTGLHRRLPEVVVAWGAARVLVVRAGASYRASGAQRAVDALPSGVAVSHVGDVRPNPDERSLARALAHAREARPDLVVGVGGGSVMDTAKILACLLDAPPAGRPAGSADALPRPAGPRRAGLVLLPTTAGSGAEMTRFATYYADGRKLSFVAPDARADLVLVDPALTASMPPASAAVCATDALCQAVESYWSVRATDLSRAWSLTALRALLAAHREALAGGGFDPRPVLAELSWGAAVAGAAIDVANTTSAHALSYALTARLGVPHGAAVGLHLPWLLRHNAEVGDDDCRHPAGAPAVRSMVDDVRSLALELAGRDLPALTGALLAASGQPTTLAELHLDVADWRPVVESAVRSERAVNNPRQVDADDVLRAMTKGA
jgi:alcohol dehydrogenase